MHRPSLPTPSHRPSRRSTSAIRHSEPRPAAAFRQRRPQLRSERDQFSAPERWHPARDDGQLKIITESPGSGYRHVLTAEEVRERVAQLPCEYTRRLEVVQFSGMTRKRGSFPCYGMQWGRAVYLYPIEESLVELYNRPPTPQQKIEARMYGGVWEAAGRHWRLIWTEEAIRRFYLDNVLIHEIGHVHDERNTNADDRERYANWFAIEFGYRQADWTPARRAALRATFAGRQRPGRSD